MSRQATWNAVDVEVATAAADAVANFLFERGAGGVVTDDAPPVGGARTRVEAHVPGADTDAVVAALRDYLAELARLEPGWTHGPIGVTAVPDVDWEAVFRAHHVPVAIGERLLVAPPWDVPPARGREVIVIEPGMAFGTGQHATTRTCLEEIEAAVRDRRVVSALDVGTGSGVLAAALVRLGVPRVVAIDVDLAVLPLAHANLARNRADAVHLVGGPVASVRGRFDLVVANLLADTIVAAADDLARAVATGGRLVVSGVLAEQVARVTGAFATLRPTAERRDGPWRTLRLEPVGA